MLIVTGILAVILGAGAYLSMNSDSDKTNKQSVENAANSSVTTTPDTQPVTQTATAKPGTYSDYTSESIASTTNTKLLFFHAPWCPQCRDLDKDIKAKGIPEGVAIIKVDYDSNQTLRKKYGVIIQTTIVRVDNNGDLVEKYVAYDEPTIDSVIKNLL